MDILPETMTVWLEHYGSFALFTLLALGIIALPVPEETLLLFTGYMLQAGKLAVLPTLCAAYFGSITGITVSFIIGYTGAHYVLIKYGSYLGLNDAKLTKMHDWFEHYGKWLLVIGYFIPGVRHFTGIFAGISTLEYSHFALYAYSGAILWVSTFLALGYFFGNFHAVLFEFVEKNMEFTFTIAIALAIVVIYVRMLITPKKP